VEFQRSGMKSERELFQLVMALVVRLSVSVCLSVCLAFAKSCPLINLKLISPRLTILGNVGIMGGHSVLEHKILVHLITSNLLSLGTP